MKAPHRVSPEPPPLRATRAVVALHRAEPPPSPPCRCRRGSPGSPRGPPGWRRRGTFGLMRSLQGGREARRDPRPWRRRRTEVADPMSPKAESGLPWAGSMAGRAMGAGCGGFRGSDDGRWCTRFPTSASPGAERRRGGVAPPLARRCGGVAATGSVARGEAPWWCALRAATTGGKGVQRRHLLVAWRSFPAVAALLAGRSGDCRRHRPAS
jgi:hypothetical protein